MKIRLFFSIILLGAFLIAPCPAETPIVVTVSILPQKYFVEKIGGERLSVNVMAPPGASPHAYEPKPKQMVSLRESRLYFSIGVEFEKTWLPRFRSANPSLEIVETQRDVEKIPMRGGHAHSHEKKSHSHKARHDEHDESSRGRAEAEFDPHIWLSPKNVKIMAKNILEALIKTDQKWESGYQKNYDSFLKELNELDEHIKKTLEGEKGASFLVFHPSWGYFAKDYGLEQIPVEIEGRNPGPRDMKAIINKAREKKIRHIFVQPQVSPKLAESLARSFDGEIVVADPLAENWANNLKEAAEKFKTQVK